jgi:hypothetical protein
MRRRLQRMAAAVLLTGLAGSLSATSKPHAILFGKWTTISLFTGREENEPLQLKIRPLYVDGKLREFTFGIPHEITDRLFVVRRVVRVNDALPEEAATSVHWTWQRNGWLAVDGTNGHISPINLPEFDPDYSSATWYRDYVAYCGMSDDGKKLFAVVMQLGRRKPILRKAIGEVSSEDRSSPGCSSPVWQRHPPRVIFLSQADQRFTFTVRGHAVETLSDNEDDEAGTE